MEYEIVRINKLKGLENWASRKFQVRVTLKFCDAWEIVTDESVFPVPGDAANRARAAWIIKLDSTAQRIIATLDEKPLLHIINCETAKDMWKKLESVYEQKTDTSAHILLQQWYSYQKEPSDDIATHIAKLENLAYRLQTLGEKIPNQMIITKIFMTLPPSFKYFISAWESTQPNERTLINLISRLTIEETRNRRKSREHCFYCQ